MNYYYLNAWMKYRWSRIRAFVRYRLLRRPRPSLADVSRIFAPPRDEERPRSVE